MLKKLTAFLFVITAIIIAAACFSWAADKQDKKDDLYKQVELFSNTLAIVKAEYVNETSPKQLIYGALKGMISSLDPYSQFMDPDSYNELKVDTEGKFGGLGIEITIDKGLLTVITPIEDTPAWKAGIKPNDRIVKINTELTRDITLSDAVKKMRGKPGEPVTLTILREKEKKVLDITVIRDIIKIKDIKEARILEDGIAYIKLIEFRENTCADLQAALDKLKEKGMASLILDLRNNPGGLLDAAVKVCEKFIPKGKIIVSTKGRQDKQNLEFVSRLESSLVDLPMVILVNAGSASGSEIVAGCMQDYKRAIILGVKSFGKGSVQSVIPLRDGCALRLTTSKYFTPLGREIHNKGIIPDIVVEEETSNNDKEKTSEDLKNEIFEDLEKNAQPQEVEFKPDKQVNHAIDVLKAISIYKK
ncbi:MAG: S41 family peptidase [Candidatus Omnitrophica bacterium]|jgi:carboxyl-terminal processing protease|nr:S41 family peptidase [Candidatus Omnitrophota bacterium]